MNKNNDIITLFNNHLWGKLANSYSPIEIAKSLSFKNGLRLAYRLLYNDAWEEQLQEYAVNLLYEIRKVHQESWKKNLGNMMLY